MIVVYSGVFAGVITASNFYVNRVPISEKTNIRKPSNTQLCSVSVALMAAYSNCDGGCTGSSSSHSIVIFISISVSLSGLATRLEVLR